MNLINEAQTKSPKFSVHQMLKTDFVSFVDLHAIIVNRKKSSDGNKVNWFKIQSMQYKRDKPFSLYVVCMDGALQEVDIQKKQCNDQSLTMCNLPVLFPDGNEISKGNVFALKIFWFSFVLDFCVYTFSPHLF